MPMGAQCVQCFRYILDHTCEAFPEGIPSDIYEGLHDHTEPYKGDKGLRFISYEDGLKKEKQKFKQLQEATIKETQTRG